MPDDLLPLSRLFVALPRWRWRPGMLATNGTDKLRITEDMLGAFEVLGLHWCKDLVPVPDDPATLGAILGLVREARNDPGIHAAPAAEHPVTWWWAYTGKGLGPIGSGPSEPAALYEALEGAP